MTQSHRRAVSCATAALAACLVLSVFAGTAQAQRFIGVVNPFLAHCSPESANRNCLSSKDIQRMSRAHVKRVRWGFRWAVVQPTRGEHRWTLIDQVIGSLASHGMRVLPVMTGTPPWAGRTYGTAPVGTAVGREGWRNFLKASVKRYGPGGDFWTDPSLYRREHPHGPIEPIKNWQIWNEQNLRKGAQHVSPGDYVRLMRISHRAIHKADPKAQIMLGGMPGYVEGHAWSYLNKLYGHHGFKRTFDSVALHPYAGDVRHVLIQIDEMRNVMRRHGDARMPLWITELGWGSKPPGANDPINKGPRGQKQYLKVVFPLLRKYHHRWNLRGAFWFRWRDPPPGTPGCTFCSSSGLFHADQKPKPAWSAFKSVTARR